MKILPILSLSASSALAFRTMIIEDDYEIIEPEPNMKAYEKIGLQDNDDYYPSIDMHLDPLDDHEDYEKLIRKRRDAYDDYDFDIMGGKCDDDDPCEGGFYCNFDENTKGLCEICPANGGSCDLKLFVLKGYRACCDDCGVTSCDEHAWEAYQQSFL